MIQAKYSNRQKASQLFNKEQELISSQKEFWVNEFAEEYKILELPADFSRPPIKGYESNSVKFELSEEETKSLKDISTEAGSSMFMILLAAYNILLSKLSNQEDIVVGTPISGHQYADLKIMVGMVENTIPLRNYPKGELSFSDFLSALTTRTLACFDNQSYRYEDLVYELNIDLDPSRNPLIDVMFSYLKFEKPELKIPGLTLHLCDEGHGITQYDLTLLARETDQKLVLTYEYSSELFKQETIERFVGYFKEIISVIISNPNKKISQIEIITKKEKDLILHTFNDTKVDYPENSSIAQSFEEQVQKTPGAIALVCEGKELSYAVLNKKADILATYLIENGVSTNTFVGIMADRSLEMIIGIIGILKAGGTYVPIDASYPRERIDYIIDDCKLSILLTLHEFKARCDFNGKMILLDDIDNILINKPYKFTSELKQDNQLAYIMYTSGSTGNPKGVMVSHKNVIRLVKNSTIIEYSNEERFMQTGNPVFDATTFEIWGSLLNGSRLYLASNEVIIDSAKLKGFLNENQISVLWLTASLFNQHVDQIPDMFQSLRYLLVGGDALSPKHINLALQNNPSISIINGYGPTENTTFSTTFNIREEYATNIPIGKPITNSTVYILSSNNTLQPIGVSGELCVGGDGVAMGYLNNSKLTAKKFVQNPFNSSETLYRTGDLARWLPDGNIEFLGRIDNQVKIRGFRIELGEIECQLSKHEKIKGSIVLVKEKQGEKYLIAYYESEKEIEISALRNHLLLKLPDYMIPAFFVQLVKFPLTPNGKVNRNALPDPEISGGLMYVAPSNELEEKLAEIWSETLGVKKEQISIHQNFFMLGGNSLNAIKTIQKIKNIIPHINTNDIFLHPTIEQLASLYSKKYVAENKKYDNIIEIENKLKSIFGIEACLLKYKLTQKTFMVLFIDKEEIINSGTFVKFIETELDDAYQPHYIIHNHVPDRSNQGREITMNDNAFFQFIKKTSPLNI